MKKNNIIYMILLMLIVLFGNSMNVRADEAVELICTYENNHRLYQNKDGSLEFYFLTEERKVESSGYMGYIDGSVDLKKVHEDDEVRVEFNTEYFDEAKGNLTACPRWVYNDNSIFKYYDNEQSGGSTSELLFGGNSSVEIGEILNSVDTSGASCDNLSEDAWLSDLIDNNLYTGSCLYRSNIESGCHIIQVDLGAKNIKITEFDPFKGVLYSNLKKTTGFFTSFDIDKRFSAYNIATQAGGDCLDIIRVNRTYTIGSEADGFIKSAYTKVYFSGKKGSNYYITNVRGNNSVTGKPLTMSGGGMSFDIIDIENCEQLLGKELANKLGIVWNLVRIAVPIVLVVLGIVDFAKAIFSGSEDTMKKSQKKFITRIIIAVVIFLIPSILSLLLQIANSVWGNIGTDICGILG